ncbi:MAG: hypothetical protein IKK11_01495 [Oscillospiraceae bacterium]|nr:hypothetical protein [Oscillospiraceae bacterium]
MPENQTSADLEKMLAWLSTYPHWADFLPVEYAGLLPRGLEETSRREDVLGNSLVGCRYQFSLSWKMEGQGIDTENAGRLLDFQHWVRGQSASGLAPKFGDVPARERIRAEKGGITAGAQIATYTVMLIADFMKVYEVN